MRSSIVIVLLATVVTLLAPRGQVNAQVPRGFPARSVKFIVPVPPGGLNDSLARILAEKLQINWRHPVVIENKTGAGGNIGAEAAYQAPPDGHTLLLSPPGPLSVNQNL